MYHNLEIDFILYNVKPSYKDISLKQWDKSVLMKSCFNVIM